MKFTFDLKKAREKEFGILLSIDNNTYVGVISIFIDDREFSIQRKVYKHNRLGYNLFLTFVEKNERADFVTFFSKDKNKKVVIDTDEIKTDETALNILTHVNILDVVKKTLIDNKENIENNSFKIDLSKYIDNFHKNLFVFGETIENEFNLMNDTFFYTLANKPVLPLSPADASLFRLFNKKELKNTEIIQIDDIQVFKTNNNFLLIGSPQAKDNPTYYICTRFEKKDFGTLEIDNFLSNKNISKPDNVLKVICDKENKKLILNAYKGENQNVLIETETVNYNFENTLEIDLSKANFNININLLFLHNKELRERMEKLPKLKFTIGKLIPIDCEYISVSLVATFEDLSFVIGRIEKQ